MPLVRQADVLDHGHGRAAGQAVQQLLLDVRAARHAHVDDQGEAQVARCGCQQAPVGGRAAGLAVPGDEHHPLGVRAVRQRRAEQRHTGHRGGDAADHFHGHAGGAQVLHLLAAAAEDERVAALEAHHVLARAHGVEHELLDQRLRRALAAAALAHVDDARAGRRQRHDGLAHQVVHQHHGGRLQRFQRLQREQLGVARAGAHEGAAPWRRGGRGERAHAPPASICRARCAMWPTCRASASGTGSAPASTARV